MVVHEWNPFETVRKLGVRVFEMPEHVLFEKKAGGENRPVYMHEVGPIALARVDGTEHTLAREHEGGPGEPRDMGQCGDHKRQPE